MKHHFQKTCISYPHITLGQSDSKVSLTLREFTGALDRGLPLLVLIFTEEPLVSWAAQTPT